MKVLFVSHQDGKYGAALALQELIELLHNNYEVQPVVVTNRNNELNKYCSTHGIENYHLHFADCISKLSSNVALELFNRFIQNLKDFCGHLIGEHELKKNLDLSTVDIVYTNVSTVDFGAWLSEKYHKPHIWHLREFLRENLNSEPASRKYYQLMNSSTRVVAISKAIGDSWIESGVRSSLVKVVYDGIEDHAELQRSRISETDLTKFVFVGSASPHKGFQQLLDAVRLLQGAKLKFIVYVYGDYENDFGMQMQKKVKSLNLSQFIVFKGFSATVRNDLPKFHVGLMCSRAEGFGRTTVEYMLSGLAVIASDTGANAEIVVNDEDGFMYHYGNSDELAMYMERYIRNHALITAHGDAGRRRALQNFTNETNAMAIFSLLKDVSITE
ncbi:MULTISPECIES: glycosyltransferase family 4 protein [Lactobacillaceae]|uniref:glycosyltransferase family 4 protein n=1 Tax=Lactobacillaceae TaxID=33958 RepID=UPI0008A4E958|nr:MULTISPECIES: glycosyltransferase family 4 protein [Lactobacillaceae]MDT8952615.1 glycosyltransferase family 4 protein [Lacticaseibacillus paracasei subsp. paracasei]OFP89916.1 hypothetical protein HMPREF2969_02415 [Lactobacillus sp. HMSC056D05]